ncbi:SDR family NAD(P)-dependent oxidoreductase [Sporichthya sp.]|uniref:SDR family NAD(P)-dependent oxidoreductase n=1 Tax=Sporichthya sp. TaxID=65475 RepID=UPI00185D74C8|nr:SDR family NAD(P)-dependent oxidoreductase [Sporichthya sp.]MBA3741975.1 SDR family NAD(P)-dependent oxidoreductase [Sporichthya sp.]
MAMLTFDGRVAVVTGAGRGLGRAYARTLAARGAAVVVNDLGRSLDGTMASDSPAQTVVEEILAAGGRAIADGNDVSTAEGGEAIVQRARESFGRLDIVVNNAGIVNKSDFPDTGFEDLERHVGVHQYGVFNVTKAAWPGFVEQGYGRVVIAVSSALYGIKGVLPYSSAKGGAFGLARGLAQLGEEHGIKVNMIAPIALTRMSTTSALSELELQTRQEALAPEKVAAVVALLAHERCPANAEIVIAAGDRVARMFLAETPGVTEVGLTPEKILDRWDAICDEAGYTVPGPALLGQGVVQASAL